MVNLTNFAVILAVLATFANAVQYGKQNYDYICSEQGRQLDKSDKTCKSYVLCTPGDHGRWITSSYTCPGDSIFDKDIGHCAINGVCKIDDDTSPAEYVDGEFKCRTPGAHDNVNDPNCASYIDCKRNSRGLLYPLEVSCPLGSRFDPYGQYCSAHYTCPRKFTCKRKGRFPNGLDYHNKQYVLCSQKTNGDFVMTEYTCPKRSVFDEEVEMCMEVEEFDSSEEEYHDYTLPTEYWEHLNRMNCVARGYFANVRDEACKTFFLCDVMGDGELYDYLLPCPDKYRWDENKKMCTK